MKYKIAIFDMDGTILDTLEDIADTLNYCLEKYAMPVRTIEEVRQFVGNGIRNLIARAVPTGTGETVVDEIFDMFIPYYKEHSAIKTRPYDGICEVIEKLKSSGIKTAVVSNKADLAVKALCDCYFRGLFDYSVGEKPGQRRKPYPDSVNEVLKYFDISKEEAVYIGDSDVDFETAKNSQMDVIMVGWGFRDEAFLHSIGAQSVIHNPEEILDIVLN